MIYSKKLQTYVPTTIDRIEYDSPQGEKMTKYVIKDGKIPVGYVKLVDIPNGVRVSFLENMYPHLYKNVGQTADQIEVEHCLKRGLTDFEIVSKAALNSHAVHYLRGKRFKPDVVNELVQKVIEETPKGQQYCTDFLGSVSMYMPLELINKYVELSKKCPLLK